MLVTQSYLTLSDPVDCSLPASSVHGIIEWVTIPFCRGYYWLRDQTGSFPLIEDSLASEPPGMLSVQLISVAQSCPTLCNPMYWSIPGLPVHHQLPEPAQTHVCWVSGAIQPSHPLLSPSPPVFNLSQHQGVFKWVTSLHQVPKILEFQLQHQSSQWIFRTDFL